MSPDPRRSRVPGTRLRGLALALFGEEVAARYLFPAIADLQHEAIAASTSGSLARARVACRGYWAFWRVCLSCLMTGGPSGASRFEWSVASRAAVATAVLAALLVARPAVSILGPLAGRVDLGTALTLLALLVPQSFAVAIPCAVLFIGFVGPSGAQQARPRAARAIFARSLAAVSLAAAAFLVVVLFWMVPAGNDAFRQVVYRAALGRPTAPPVPKGLNEMTIGEMRQARLDVVRWSPAERLRLDYAIHTRAAIAVAPVVFALFTITTSSRARRARRRWPRATMLAVATVIVYYLVTVIGRSAVLGAELPIPPWFAAWAPNLAFGAVALAVLIGRAVRLATPPARQ